MNGGWRLESKLCWKLQTIIPLKEYDHVTYQKKFSFDKSMI
jgi:hypothetical protein